MKKSVAQFIQDQGYLEGIKTQEDLSKLLKELGFTRSHAARRT